MLRPEIKDSAYQKSDLARERVYAAFEIYKKFKQEGARPLVRHSLGLSRLMFFKQALNSSKMQQIAS